MTYRQLFNAMKLFTKEQLDTEINILDNIREEYYLIECWVFRENNVPVLMIDEESQNERHAQST